MTVDHRAGFECKCCASHNAPRTFVAREMMYGTRESFEYAVCVDCDSMQLLQVPEDMSPYYQQAVYSSWGGVPTHIKRRPSPLRHYLLGQRTDVVLNGHNPVGTLLTRAFGAPEFPYDWNWFSHLGIKRSHHILDFGCGTGGLLYYLRSNGFENLVGVDKFATVDESSDGLRFFRALPESFKEGFDLIMSHHSMEHVERPFDELLQLKEFLRPGGSLLIRLPAAHSYAAKEYGPNWVQLDAPRHIVVPSESGMRILGDRIGLTLLRVEYDSTEYQFIGSEQYRADISMYDTERSWMLGRHSPFDARQREKLAARAAELNAAGLGDQAVYYFRADNTATVPALSTA